MSSNSTRTNKRVDKQLLCKIFSLYVFLQYNFFFDFMQMFCLFFRCVFFIFSPSLSRSENDFQRMKQFINQEAADKAMEIRIKTKELCIGEKARYIRSRKKSTEQEFAFKQQRIIVEHRKVMSDLKNEYHMKWLR